MRNNEKALLTFQCQQSFLLGRVENCYSENQSLCVMPLSINIFFDDTESGMPNQT